jgi:hypothetical protein
MSMLEYMGIVIIACIATGSFVIVQFKLNNLKNKFRQFVLGYMIMLIATGLLLIPYLSATPSEAFMAMIAKVCAMETSVFSLYFINKFGRYLIELPTSKKHNIRVKLFFVLFPISIFSPTNRWDTNSFFEPSFMSTQPIILIVLLGLAIYVFITAIERCKFASTRLLEPTLKEIYIWILRGFKSISLSLISLFFFTLYYLFPPNTQIITQLTAIAFGIGGLGVIGSIFSIYIGLILPKTVLKKIYRSYTPMWLHAAVIEERCINQIRKLQEVLFE